MFRRIHLLLVILLPAILPAQAVFLGINAGAGLSKLEPKPTSSFTGFERAPAYLLGATLEYVTLKSVISGKLGFWFEWGGEDDNPVALMTIPLLVKASVGKKWKPYLEGGLAGCYVYERSRRYQTGDFAGIYGAGLEHILPRGAGSTWNTSIWPGSRASSMSV